MIDLKELKGGSLRCVIPYKDNEGSHHEIEVYNIIGERRKEILDELMEIISKIDEVGEMALDSYYTDLLMEFTNIKVDDTNINDIMVNPKLEWKILIHELDEMVYELQYEAMCEKINQGRALILDGMRQQLELEFSVFADFVKRSNENLNEIRKKEQELGGE